MQKETALLINSLLEHLEKECSTAALIEDARGNLTAAEKLRRDRQAVLYAIQDFKGSVRCCE